MIKIDGSKADIGNCGAIQLLSEVSLAVKLVSEAVAKQVGRTEEDVVNDIFSALRFSTLKESGMSSEEAMDVLGYDHLLKKEEEEEK